MAEFHPIGFCAPIQPTSSHQHCYGHIPQLRLPRRENDVLTSANIDDVTLHTHSPHTRIHPIAVDPRPLHDPACRREATATQQPVLPTWPAKNGRREHTDSFPEQTAAAYNGVGGLRLTLSLWRVCEDDRPLGTRMNWSRMLNTVSCSTYIEKVGGHVRLEKVGVPLGASPLL